MKGVKFMLALAVSWVIIWLVVQSIFGHSDVCPDICSKETSYDQS